METKFTLFDNRTIRINQRRNTALFRDIYYGFEKLFGTAAGRCPKMIQYKVENIMLMDDEKSFLVDLTIELEDMESGKDPVYISLSFPLANESNDLEEIKEKAVIHAKSLLKRVLIEDAQRELF